MTTTAVRKAAAQKANKGQLGLVEAIQKGVTGIWAKNHAKFWAAVLAVAGTALSQGLLHGQVETIVTVAVTVIGALGVKTLDNRVSVSED